MSSPPFRLQVETDASAFAALGGPALLTSMQFSLGASGSTLSFPTSTLRVGLTSLDHNSLTTDLNGNATGPQTLVANGLTLTSTSGPYDLLLSFTTPFLYDPAQGNLLVDFLMQEGSGPVRGRLESAVGLLDGKPSIEHRVRESVAAERADPGLSARHHPGQLLWQSFSRTQFTTRLRLSHTPDGCPFARRPPSIVSGNSTRVRCGGYWLITGRIFSRFTTPAMEILTALFPCSRPRSWKSSCAAGTHATGSLCYIAPIAKFIWQCHFLARPAFAPVASIGVPRYGQDDSGPGLLPLLSAVAMDNPA